MEELSFAYSSKINYIIDSIKYKDLWGAENYTIDHENRKIYMTMFDSGEKKEYVYWDLYEKPNRAKPKKSVWLYWDNRQTLNQQAHRSEPESIM